MMQLEMRFQWYLQAAETFPTICPLARRGTAQPQLCATW